MKRRELLLLLGSAMAAPPALWAQHKAMPVLGWLVFEAGEGGLDGFRQGLREHGYVDGQNIAIEVRTPEDSDDRLVEQIEDLARLNVKVLITGGVPATLAAKRAALPIPVVFIMADPVGSGVVASLAHPGGTMTGQSLAIEEQFAGKWLELLKEANTKDLRFWLLRAGPFGREQQRGEPGDDDAATPHSMTSSARARINGGIVRPRAAAVFMLTKSSSLVACSTGRSAGLAPFRIRST